MTQIKICVPGKSVESNPNFGFHSNREHRAQNAMSGGNRHQNELGFHDTLPLTRHSGIYRGNRKSGYVAHRHLAWQPKIGLPISQKVPGATYDYEVLDYLSVPVPFYNEQ